MSYEEKNSFNLYILIFTILYLTTLKEKESFIVWSYEKWMSENSVQVYSAKHTCHILQFQI